MELVGIMLWGMVLGGVGVGESAEVTVTGGQGELKVVITEEVAKLELTAERLRAAGDAPGAEQTYQALIAAIRQDDRFSPSVKDGIEIGYTRKIALGWQEVGDPARALVSYRAMLRLAEDSGNQEAVLSTLLGMGKLAVQYARGEGVVEVFEARRADLSDEAVVLLGDIYRAGGQSQEAMGVYREVLASHLGPQVAGRVVPGCYGVGPEQRAGMEALAAEAGDIRLWLETHAADDPQAALVLGERAWEEGDYEKALVAFARAGEQVPDDGMIELQVARTLLMLDRSQEAIEKLDEVALKLSGPGELLELSTAYLLVDSVQSAEVVLRRLIREYPTSPEAREAGFRIGVMGRRAG